MQGFNESKHIAVLTLVGLNVLPNLFVVANCDYFQIHPHPQITTAVVSVFFNSALHCGQVRWARIVILPPYGKQI